MAADGFSIEELKSKIGVEGPPLVYEIETGMIRRFAQTVGDLNPLWQDDEYGAKSGFGSIIAPPTFVLILGFDQIIHPLTKGPSRTVLHGSTELDYYQPVKPKDVITVTTKIASVRERGGKIGRMTFVTFDITYKNQRQEVVAKCRQMAIIR
jgi:acyl dehydratase